MTKYESKMHSSYRWREITHKSWQRWRMWLISGDWLRHSKQRCDPTGMVEQKSQPRWRFASPLFLKCLDVYRHWDKATVSVFAGKCVISQRGIGLKQCRHNTRFFKLHCFQYQVLSIPFSHGYNKYMNIVTCISTICVWGLKLHFKNDDLLYIDIKITSTGRSQ